VHGPGAGPWAEAQPCTHCPWPTGMLAASAVPAVRRQRRGQGIRGSDGLAFLWCLTLACCLSPAVLLEGSPHLGNDTALNTLAIGELFESKQSLTSPNRVPNNCNI